MHRWATRAATAVVAVAALGALGACSSDGEPGLPSSPVASTSAGATTTVSPGGDWTLGLDSQPTRAVAAEDRVFVTSAGSARYPPQIYAVDTATGQEIEHRTATGQPYGLLVAPDGRLWVVGDRHPDQAGGAGVNVYDPDSLVVVEHADLPGQALSVAQVGEEIWVGSDAEVLVLDATTIDLIRTIPIGGPAYDLIVLPADAGVIVVEGDRLERVSPDGAVVASQPIAADGNMTATAAASTLWVRAPVSADSTVLSLDPLLTGPAVRAGVDTDSTGGGILATRAGDVLLVDDRRDEVLCLQAGAVPPIHTPATDLVGVLAELPDGRSVFATSTGVAARDITC